MIESSAAKKEIIYPSEIVFKTVFRNSPYTLEIIKNIIHEHADCVTVTAKESSGGKFISYTITAVFESEDRLNSSCSQITMAEGFMMIF